MNKPALEPDKTCVVIDFQKHKLRDIAREYVRRLAEYGIESASLWTMDKIKDGNERELFDKFVKLEMCKYGFVVRAR